MPRLKKGAAPIGGNRCRLGSQGLGGITCAAGHETTFGRSQCMGWKSMRKYFLSAFVGTHRNLCEFLHRTHWKTTKSNVRHQNVH
jgi:hypothetical protein